MSLTIGFAVSRASEPPIYRCWQCRKHCPYLAIDIILEVSKSKAIHSGPADLSEHFWAAFSPVFNQFIIARDGGGGAWSRLISGWAWARQSRHPSHSPPRPDYLPPSFPPSLLPSLPPSFTTFPFLYENGCCRRRVGLSVLRPPSLSNGRHCGLSQ